MNGIKFVSYFEPSGYGLAALAYLRGLVNAGVAVQWVPVQRVGWSDTLPWRQSHASSAILEMARNDDTLADLPALMEKTLRPCAYDTVLLHTIPEHWAAYWEAGKHNVGFTTWESDTLPAHWPPLLNRADHILVPCRMNDAVFRRCDVKKPVSVVPHIRRHQWHDVTPGELADFRRDLGVPEGDFVFYTINTWDPRKNLDGLLRAYIRAFRSSDPVTLIVKTGASGSGPGPFYPFVGSTQDLVREIVRLNTAALGREAPRIVMLAHDALPGRQIDALHEIGDCFVSLSRGEGWGLGAFDAATLGVPVLMTGWGGQTDFLGDSWPGALPYRMARCSVWPPPQPSFHTNQRWAEPDENSAGEMMRRIVANPAPFRAAAAPIRENIATRFAEGVVTRQLLAALSA